jgi:hypothetical protein
VWNTAIDFLTHAREFAELEFLLRRILVPLGRLCQLTKHAMVGSEKPNFFEEVPLHPQKVGVWAVILRRRNMGPIFFDGTNTIKMFFSKKLTIPIFSGTLTAVRYREIIQQFLEQLHHDEIVNGYFQQDGAPAHTIFETFI